MRIRLGTFRRALIESLIVEGRLEKVRNAYPNVNVERLAASDPSGNNKYLEWMARQVSGGSSIRDVVEAVLAFHANSKRLKQRDISKYKTLDSLNRVLQSTLRDKSKTQAKREIRSGADTIYKSEQFTVRYVPNKDVCMLLGKGTKWCVTEKDNPYFEEYHAKGASLYFIFRNDPDDSQYDKIAAAVLRGEHNELIGIQYWDAVDNPMNSSKQKDVFANELSKIESSIIKHAESLKVDGDIHKLLRGELEGSDFVAALENNEKLIRFGFEYPIADATKNYVRSTRDMSVLTKIADMSEKYISDEDDCDLEVMSQLILHAALNPALSANKRKVLLHDRPCVKKLYSRLKSRGR